MVLGKRTRVGHFDSRRVFLRMLERLSWYDPLDLLGMGEVRARLTPQLIAGLRRQEDRDINTSAEYCTTKLCPFQDGILDIVRRSGTPFYLTGGTALSRRWYGHRYSEALDLRRQ